MTAAPDVIAARLKLKRRVAAVLLDALAETGLALTDLDDALGKRRGTMQRFFVALMTGRTRELDAVSDMAFAMGMTVDFHAAPRQHASDHMTAADIGLEE